MRVEVTSSIAIDHEELAEASVISKTGKKYADGCLNFRIWRWMSQSDGWQPFIGQQPDLFLGKWWWYPVLTAGCRWNRTPGELGSCALKSIFVKVMQRSIVMPNIHMSGEASIGQLGWDKSQLVESLNQTWPKKSGNHQPRWSSAWAEMKQWVFIVFFPLNPTPLSVPRNYWYLEFDGWITLRTSKWQASFQVTTVGEFFGRQVMMFNL